jgi:ribosome-associated protein
LNQLQALASRPKAATRLSRSSKVFKTIIKAIEEKKGEKIVSLDLRKIPEAVADFFIICEATTNIQVKGIADHVQDRLKDECGEMAYKHEGYQHAKWVLIDYVNVVVHVMQPESRKFYRLEELWSDAPVVEHDEAIEQ